MSDRMEDPNQGTAGSPSPVLDPAAFTVTSSLKAHQISASTALTTETVESYLLALTDSTCPRCGREALQRFEVMNDRCESCRVAELEATGASDPRTYRPESGCPVCLGLGWYETAANGERLPSGKPRYYQSARCTRTGPSDEGERIFARLSLSGTLPECRRCSFATWEGPQPPEVLTFLNDPEGFQVLLITGKEGRGKTHLSTAAFRELLAHGRSGQWIDCSELVDRCRRWVPANQGDAMDEELEQLYRADLPFLDDLGTRRQTDFARDRLDGIIRHRHARQLPMIITCNRTLAGIVTRVEDGDLDRPVDRPPGWRPAPLSPCLPPQGGHELKHRKPTSEDLLRPDVPASTTKQVSRLSPARRGLLYDRTRRSAGARGSLEVLGGPVDSPLRTERKARGEQGTGTSPTGSWRGAGAAQRVAGRMDENFPYGPFHRLQSAVDNERMAHTGIVGGKRARNIYAGSEPKVKAFVGSLPSGKAGIEFYSTAPPDEQTPPHRAEWSKGAAGVIELGPDPKDGEEMVGIRVKITKRADS